MQGIGADGARRTRRLTRAQSKYGCLTCKSRKVRCDEAQPTCQRCANSGFVCEGYTTIRPVSPSRAQSGASLSRSTSGSRPDVESFAPDEFNTRQKLIDMLQSSIIAYVGRDALENVIKATPQFAPSSSMAVSALEILIQRDDNNTSNVAELRLQVDTAYGQAIRLFVDEIRQGSGSSGSIFVTGVVLIAIELLQRRRQDAWKHLLGSRQWLRSTMSPDVSFDDVEFLHCIYDLQSMLYSQNVRLPMTGQHERRHRDVADFENLPSKELERATVRVLHSAHSLISSLHNSDHVQNMLEGPQGDEQLCLSDLYGIMQLMNRKIYAQIDSQEECTLLILRNLCQMTIMELEQLRCTEETSWDEYEKGFQTIIEAAENIRSRHLGAIASTRYAGHLQLTLQLGFIPPLLLSALKFRHPIWRRRAISCLQIAGIEGPFIGKQLAAIARRCMEIEESEMQTSIASAEPGVSSSTAHTTMRVPTEDHRVAYCRTEEEIENTDRISWPPAAKGTTITLFLARKRAAPLLPAKALISRRSSIGNMYDPVQNEALDMTTWRLWTETIEFNGAVEQAST